MYFLRLNPIIGHKKTFIFGEVEKTENPYFGIYTVYLKNGMGFYNNRIENIYRIEATDFREIKELHEVSKPLIKYLFKE